MALSEKKAKSGIFLQLPLLNSKMFREKFLDTRLDSLMTRMPASDEGSRGYESGNFIFTSGFFQLS